MMCKEVASPRALNSETFTVVIFIFIPCVIFLLPRLSKLVFQGGPHFHYILSLALSFRRGGLTYNTKDGRSQNLSRPSLLSLCTNVWLVCIGYFCQCLYLYPKVASYNQMSPLYLALFLSFILIYLSSSESLLILLLQREAHFVSQVRNWNWTRTEKVPSPLRAWILCALGAWILPA